MIKIICAIVFKSLSLVVATYVFTYANVVQLNPVAPYPAAVPIPYPSSIPSPYSMPIPVGAMPMHAPIPAPIITTPNQPMPIIVQNTQPLGIRPQMIPAPMPLNGAIPIQNGMPFPNGAIPIPSGMPFPNGAIPIPSGMPIPISVGISPIQTGNIISYNQQQLTQLAPALTQAPSVKPTDSVTLPPPTQPINNQGLPEITKVFDPQNAPKEPDKIDPLLKPTRVIVPQIKREETPAPTNLVAPLEVATIDTASIKPVEYKPEPIPELTEAEKCYVPPPAPKKVAPKPVVVEKKEEKPKKKKAKKGKKKKAKKGKKKKGKKGKKGEKDEDSDKDNKPDPKKGKSAPKADDLTAEADSDE